MTSPPLFAGTPLSLLAKLGGDGFGTAELGLQRDDLVEQRLRRAEGNRLVIGGIQQGADLGVHVAVAVRVAVGEAAIRVTIQAVELGLQVGKLRLELAGQGGNLGL